MLGMLGVFAGAGLCCGLPLLLGTSVAIGTVGLVAGSFLLVVASVGLGVGVLPPALRQSRCRGIGPMGTVRRDSRHRASESNNRLFAAARPTVGRVWRVRRGSSRVALPDRTRQPDRVAERRRPVAVDTVWS
jgi:hypothetical protein